MVCGVSLGDDREAGEGVHDPPLVLPHHHSHLSVYGTTSAADLVIAERYQVHPSVVLGRVQRDKQNWKLHRTHVPKVRALLADQGVLA